MTDFIPFPKIPRLNRNITITEKIDGTNASVAIGEDGSIRAGSRTRWITPQDDNFGFARWVEGNKDELLKLGPGTHYGEWWGNGIQRGYGLKEKRFSLFNTHRWTDNPDKPECCHVVPVLYHGPFDQTVINMSWQGLAREGSRAAPGFMDPEGIIVFHEAARSMFKVTCKDDQSPKGLKEAA